MIRACPVPSTSAHQLLPGPSPEETPAPSWIPAVSPSMVSRAPTPHEYQTPRRGNVHRCGLHSASGERILHRIPHQVEPAPHGSATIVGTDGRRRRWSGTPGDDVIAGGLGDDVIRGLAGNDVLCGDRWDRLAWTAGRATTGSYGGLNGLQQPYPDNPPDNVGDDARGRPRRRPARPRVGRRRPTPTAGSSPTRSPTPTLRAGVQRRPGATPAASGDGDDTLVLEGRVQVVGTVYDDVLVSGDEFSDEMYGGARATTCCGAVRGATTSWATPSDLPTPDEVAVRRPGLRRSRW